MSNVRVVVIADSNLASSFQGLIDAYLTKILDLLQESYSGSQISLATVLSLPGSFHIRPTTPLRWSRFKPLPDALADLPALFNKVNGTDVLFGPDQHLLDAFVIAMELLEAEQEPALAQHILTVTATDLISTGISDIFSVPMPCWYNLTAKYDGTTWARLISLLKSKEIKCSLVAAAYVPKLESFHYTVCCIKILTGARMDASKAIPLLDPEHAIIIAPVDRPAPKRSAEDPTSALPGAPLKRQRTQEAPHSSAVPEASVPAPGDPANMPSFSPAQAEAVLNLIESQMRTGKIAPEEARRTIAKIKEHQARLLQQAQNNASPSIRPSQPAAPPAANQTLPSPWTGGLLKTVTDNAGNRRDLYAYAQAVPSSIQHVQSLALFAWPRQLDLNVTQTWDLQKLNTFVQNNGTQLLALSPLNAETLVQTGLVRDQAVASKNEALFGHMAKSLFQQRKVSWTHTGPALGNGIALVSADGSRAFILVFHRTPLPDSFFA